MASVGIGIGVVPGFVDRSGTTPVAGRGTTVVKLFLDASDGLGGGARITCRGGFSGTGSSTTASLAGGALLKPRLRGSRDAGILGPLLTAGGVLRICSDTWRCAGGGVPEKPRARGSRAVTRSDTVLARDGADVDTVSRLGGRGSTLAKPSDLGSRVGAVAVREKPMVLASIDLGGVVVFVSAGRDFNDWEISLARGGLG